MERPVTILPGRFARRGLARLPANGNNALEFGRDRDRRAAGGGSVEVEVQGGGALSGAGGPAGRRASKRTTIAFLLVLGTLETGWLGLAVYSGLRLTGAL